jgi:hypothetical protein
LPVQIDRLYAARIAAVASTENVRRARYYGQEDSEPFYRLQAEEHMTLTAARQLLRALRAFDDDQRLPSSLTNQRIRDVRDALEHWDNPQKAAARLAEQGIDPRGHRWSPAGHGMLAGIISDAELRQWAQDVLVDLRGWDPPVTAQM